MTDGASPVRFYTFTDFGGSSVYAGQMSAVLHRIQPRAHVTSLTDEVPRQNPEAAAFLLKNSIPYLPDTAYILCVVDPGVGSNRDIVAVKSARKNHFFVGPDNGLFGFLNETGARGHFVENDSLFREHVSDTFHGRDIMAPVLARLSRSVNLEETGPEVASFRTLQPPNLLEPSISEEKVEGRIVYADPFGNLITNIHRDDLPRDLRLNRSSHVRITAGHFQLDSIQRRYSAVEPGSTLALFGSTGYLELAVNQGSAENKLDLSGGDQVILNF